LSFLLLLLSHAEFNAIEALTKELEESFEED
jgi:hypothetical protein